MLHEGLVLALEIRFEEVLEMRCLLDRAEHLRARDELLTKRRPIAGDHREDDSVEHEVLEFHELRRREGWHHLEEEIRRLFPTARCHQVDALVDLQLVPPLPIAALAKLDLRGVDLLLHERMIIEEETNANDCEDVVELATDADCLLICILIALHGCILVADAVIELGLREESIADLDVAKVLLRIRYLLLKLSQFFVVLLFHLRLERLINRSEGRGAEVLLIVGQHAVLLDERKNL
mmetsp:Transcript_56019/g.120586  ORF Transcript_56019/g.120586 Transcript_56019/m.120586 type:complete len:237 (-) Transcript_56019:147-857(-)